MDIRTYLFKLIIFISLISIIGCQSADKEFYPYQLDIAKYQELSGTKKVILVPTQLFDIENNYDNKTYRSLDLGIKSYLEKQGYEVFISEQAEDLWNESKQQKGGFYDQVTGNVIRSRVKESIQSTIEGLGKILGTSMVIIPEVLYHTIDLKRKKLNKAVWNGVKREVDSSFGHQKGWTRQVAMSLVITVYADIPLESIFSSKGGIDFITKNRVKKAVYSREMKTFEEISEERISEAIEIAFHPFINSSRIEKTMPGSYIKMVNRKIAMFMEYPEKAKAGQVEGRGVVRFKITSLGDAKDIEIIKPSGHTILDTQAKKIINLASPFPPPPARFFKGDVRVELPFIFKP